MTAAMPKEEKVEKRANLKKETSDLEKYEKELEEAKKKLENLIKEKDLEKKDREEYAPNPKTADGIKREEGVRNEEEGEAGEMRRNEEREAIELRRRDGEAEEKSRRNKERERRVKNEAEVRQSDEAERQQRNRARRQQNETEQREEVRVGDFRPCQPSGEEREEGEWITRRQQNEMEQRAEVRVGDFRPCQPSGKECEEGEWITEKTKRIKANNAAEESACSKEWGMVRLISLPGGVLDRRITERYQAIAQQTNCVGCSPGGLAGGIATLLQYGCPYEQRKEGRSKNLAVEADWVCPGTISVRRSSNMSRPAVINMFAQWEIGPALKYNRVKCPVGQDSAANREKWFKSCLDRITVLDEKPLSIAFPQGIGCDRGGGHWPSYNAMIKEFARENREVEVVVVHRSEAGGKPQQRRIRNFGQFE